MAFNRDTYWDEIISSFIISSIMFIFICPIVIA